MDRRRKRNVSEAPWAHFEGHPAVPEVDEVLEVQTPPRELERVVEKLS